MTDPTTEARLQASLDKLRQAHTTFLIHSAEYSAFIEELAPLPSTASYSELLEAGRRFGGTLVDERDVVSVLGGKDTGIKRGKDAVIRALERRLDWVNDNIGKVQRQIDMAERAIIEGREVGEGELPIVEVEEEVDEEGNVLESVIREKGGQVRNINVKDVPDFVNLLNKVGKEGDDIIEARKAGGMDENKVLASSPKNDVAPITKAVEKESVLSEEEVEKDIKQVGTSKTDPLDTAPLQPKQSPDSLTSVSQEKVERIKNIVEQEERIAALKEANAAPTSPEVKKKKNLSFSDSEEGSDVEEVGHVPPGWQQTNPNDTEEEARLRREMLKYNISEIGPIVAELNIEEASEDEQDYNDDEYGFDSEDEEDEEYEDEHGRSTKRMVTDELREEMARLQAKIAARESASQPADKKKDEEGPVLSARNAGPMQPMTPSILPKKATKDTTSATPTDTKPKSVRFNSELDISPAPPHVEPLPESVPTKQQVINSGLPVLEPDQEDAIPFLVQLLEQSDAYKNKEIPGLDHLEGTELEVEKPIVRKKKEKGPSLFKKARHQNEEEKGAEEKPAPPASGIMSSGLVERAPPTKAPVPPTAPTPKGKSILSNTLVERPPVPPSASQKSKASPILSDTLIERPPQPAAAPTVKPKKLTAMNPLLPPPEGHPLSRFRSMSARDVSPPPEDRSSQPLLSSTIVEKPPTKAAAEPAAEPDEFDVDIQRGEAAQKLVALQSKLARKEGGVLSGDAKELVELDEQNAPQGTEAAGRKKVSKFRQMRMGGIGGN